MEAEETTATTGEVDAQGPRPNRRRSIALGLGAAVVVVALAGTGLAWRSHNEHGNALSECQSARSAYGKAVKSSEDASESAGQVKGVGADQVKDPKTISALQEAVKDKSKSKSKSAPAACDPSLPTKDLKANRSVLDRSTSQMTAQATRISKAAEAVIASRDAKSMDDARAALQGKRDEAGALLVTSEGNVADGATRETLTAAIQTADGLLADGKTQLQALRDGAGPLQAAMDQVNASIQAKTDADNQAAAAQAQAQQQAVAPSYQGGGGYAGGGYRGGGSSALTPTPAAPSPAPSSGTSEDWKDFLNHHTPSKCVKGGACPIG
ncbi:hypothetical protein CRD60_04640 [Bifidobacterium aemilianum]|uniref:Colicin transporter n=1 Tax=Bifidobacterium aemilianum TaxID=2493120 RepID=A0A366K811_9BIFI|nr:hypothetical protein [Bifidobacterium aemilianum]RBP97875.1 hypothetical protein CRD60_04640 [Bifidobacterium aemilianum]